MVNRSWCSVHHKSYAISYSTIILVFVDVPYKYQYSGTIILVLLVLVVILKILLVVIMLKLFLVCSSSSIGSSKKNTQPLEVLFSNSVLYQRALRD